jgi:hypothetical protein
MVARPLRKLYPLQRMTRRRHRTWMVSMTLATLAMAVWGLTVLMMRYFPDSTPSFGAVFALACLFAVPGFLLGLFTVRARFAWLMFAMVPLFANGMALFLPWVVHRLRDSGV